MKFVYEKKSNIKIDQKLYGIVQDTMYTYGGVYEIIVDDIDWNDEIIYFSVDQPCGQVACTFSEMELYVFETEDEAKMVSKDVSCEEGLIDVHIYY